MLPGYACQGELFKAEAESYTTHIRNNRQLYRVRDPQFYAMFSKELYRSNQGNEEEVKVITTNLLSVYDKDMLGWGVSNVIVDWDKNVCDFLYVPWNAGQFKAQQKYKRKLNGKFSIPEFFKSPYRGLDVVKSEADAVLAGNTFQYRNCTQQNLTEVDILRLKTRSLTAFT